VAVQTEINGMLEQERILRSGSIFSEDSMTLKVWSYTTLAALSVLEF
jgi:hypothetical protein